MGFGYSLQVIFDHEVERHSFTLRCTPRDTLRQRVSRTMMSVSPMTGLSLSRDSFGNILTEGNVAWAHSAFSVSITGVVEVMGCDPGFPVPEEAALPNDAMMYRQQSGKTVPGDAIRSLAGSVRESDGIPGAASVMHSVHSSVEYRRGATDASTTAEQAMSGGAGVCQDMAHILISALRLRGFPARYVVGLTEGEGESHAWAEVLVDGTWYGLDPTADRFVGTDHIKISHGRDYDDCRINRGVFYGGRVSSQQASALVTASERFPRIFP